MLSSIPFHSPYVILAHSNIPLAKTRGKIQFVCPAQRDAPLDATLLPSPLFSPSCISPRLSLHAPPWDGGPPRPLGSLGSSLSATSTSTLQLVASKPCVLSVHIVSCEAMQKLLP